VDRRELLGAQALGERERERAHARGALGGNAPAQALQQSLQDRRVLHLGSLVGVDHRFMLLARRDRTAPLHSGTDDAE
jgi:hypothetical protein